MSIQSYCSYIIYLLTLISLISVFLYAYENRTEFLPIFIHGDNGIFKRLFNQSRTNQFLEHISKCPECVLFLFANKSSVEQENIFEIFNDLPRDTKAIFYPLTMNLFYNQPIPYYTILSDNPRELTRQTRQYWINSIEELRSINKNSILYFILRSLKKPFKKFNYSWANKPKLILYYTKFFGNNYWYNPSANAVYSNDFNFNNCPISANACHITIDHKDFSSSDASLIHLRESINYKKLKNQTRRSDQRFVFFLKESPVHSPTLSANEHGQLFNYTQTYRPDSDITGTTLRDLFWLFNEKIYPNYDFQSILRTKQSGNILVAIVSNCGGSSSRLKYIKELQQYVSVDIFGKCGKPCPPASDCRKYVYARYKFYLAFENSLCDEYVTEKFFYALHSAQIIPIVLGWARYDHYIPPSGYIDVRNFTSPKHLAEYIDYLDKNTTAYLEYFQWRQYALHIKLPKYMCELCLKLFLDDRDNRQQALVHIDQYWNSKTQCHSYKKYPNGQWIME